MTKGWRLESARHALARRGIESGRKKRFISKIIPLKENESICSGCDKKINDDTETKWSKDADPYCKECFEKLNEEEEEEKDIEEEHEEEIKGNEEEEEEKEVIEKEYEEAEKTTPKLTIATASNKSKTGITRDGNRWKATLRADSPKQASELLEMIYEIKGISVHAAVSSPENESITVVVHSDSKEALLKLREELLHTIIPSTAHWDWVVRK